MADDAGGGDQPTAVNHLGLCVTDIERSQRFYQEVLGFRFWFDLSPADEHVATLIQLEPPIGVDAVYLTHGATVLELIRYRDAGTRDDNRRVMNDLGFTHLSMAVTDIPATCAAVEAHGGEVVKESDMGGLAIMVKDPDGQLIELTTFGFRDRRPPLPD